MTACVNLQQRFGDKFQIELDESYHGQYGENARTVDPWYMQIPCQHGHICPWGGDILAACTDRSGASGQGVDRVAPYRSVDGW